MDLPSLTPFSHLSIPKMSSPKKPRIFSESFLNWAYSQEESLLVLAMKEEHQLIWNRSRKMKVCDTQSNHRTSVDAFFSLVVWPYNFPGCLQRFSVLY